MDTAVRPCGQDMGPSSYTRAQVAVENTVYHFDKRFDYRIPGSLRGKVLPGCRVLVPFAAG